VLPAAGLAHYEVSNFARPGAACRHNLRYWHNEPHLGLGPAAAGFVDEVRYKNVADTAAYVQAIQAGRSPWSEQERLPPERRARETAMLELRLTAGIDRQRFKQRYAEDPALLFAAAIERHGADGLLTSDETSIRLTRAGFLLADRVIADFL
jgi:oxygen-independent coproporphyrinogen-3 oxidase